MFIIVKRPSDKSIFSESIVSTEVLYFSYKLWAINKFSDILEFKNWWKNTKIENYIKVLSTEVGKFIVFAAFVYR